MGLFDIVMVPCPKCDKRAEFQSKGREFPFMDVYDLEFAPEDVLSDVNRHAPITCGKCGCSFSVVLAPSVKEGPP